MKKYPVLLIVIMILTACKSQPPQKIPEKILEKMPVSKLEFNRIEANGIHNIILHYHFNSENPRTSSVVMTIQGWKIVVNNREIDLEGAILKNNETVFSNIQVTTAAGKVYETDFELHLDLKSILNTISGDKSGSAFQADDIDSYTSELILDVSFRYGTEQPMIEHIKAITEFPRIREPEFSISSIAIMQAELINTRFAVTLTIDNRNTFPVTLSSFNYELYGHNLYWADGNEKNVLTIPAKNSEQKRLLLMMNFINMKRSLLDEIIAMRQVSYRFTGAARVETGIQWLPQFEMVFDKSGYSEVVQ